MCGIVVSMAKDLADKHCKPCEGGVDSLRPDQVDLLLKALHKDWTVSDDGLAIVRRVARKLRGDVSVESSLGSGSTFYVGLPRSISSLKSALSR